MKRGKLQMTILLLCFLLRHVVTTVHAKIVKRTCYQRKERICEGYLRFVQSCIGI